MARGIRITREDVEVADLDGLRVYRLRVTASDGDGLPNAIFLHQRVIPDIATPLVTRDEFVAIASPVDLTVYPATNPTVGQDPPYFRKTSYDVLLRSTEEVEELWLTTQVAVESLYEASLRLDVLFDAETITYGSPGP